MAAYKPPGPTDKPVRGIFFKNGKWYANWSGVDGRMRNVAVGSKAAALARYQDEKAEVRRRRRYPDLADPNENARLTVEQLLERYRPTWEGQAQARQCRLYQRVWTEALGPRFADQVRPGDLEIWRSEQLRAEDPLSVASTNRYLSYLRRQYNLAIRDELADRNPAAQLGLLRENNARVRYLLEEEEAQLRDYLPRHHWRVVAFALHTGLRRSEQVGERGLRRTSFDFRVPPHGSLYIVQSKSGRARSVPLNEEARAIVDELLAEHDEPWLFPGRWAGEPYSLDAATHGMLDACRALGIQDFRWHDLRHTFCSRLVMAGVPLIVVKELAGHLSIKTTERYAHLAPGLLATAVQSLPGEVAAARFAAEVMAWFRAAGKLVSSSSRPQTSNDCSE